MERVIVVGNANLNGGHRPRACRERHFDVCGPAGSGACLAFHGDTIRRGATSSKWFNKKVDGRGQYRAFNQDANGVGVRIVFALDVGRAP